MTISIIIPAFNEEGNIGPLLKEVADTCSAIPHELILVDDGSTDQTKKEALSVQNGLSNFRIISFPKNFGQSAALAAGVDFSKGDIIVPLDGDGQNDPADIPLLLKELNKGYDVVSGWRWKRKDNLFTRIIPSKLANSIISVVTGVHLHDFGCTLKAYRKKFIQEVQITGEMHRFLPAWCAWRGAKVTEIKTNHRPRKKGKSKYGIMRITKVLIDLLTLKFFSGYISKPNYLFSGSGFFLIGLSLVSAGLAFFDKFGPNYYPEYRIPLLLFGVFSGILAIFFIFLGLLAELTVRLYFSIQNQKPYVVINEKMD